MGQTHNKMISYIIFHIVVDIIVEVGDMTNHMNMNMLYSWPY